MSQITPKKSNIYWATNSLLNDVDFIKRVEGIRADMQSRPKGMYVPSEAESLSEELGLGDGGRYAFDRYFTTGSLDSLRNDLLAHLDPIKVTVEARREPDFEAMSEAERDYYDRFLDEEPERLDVWSYPLALRISPFVTEAQLIKYIHDNWKGIREELDKYGTEVRFNSQRNEDTTRIAMRMKREGRNIKDIVAACDATSVADAEGSKRVYTQKDVETLISDEEERISKARKMRIIRK
jgi:hypothetical protein